MQPDENNTYHERVIHISRLAGEQGILSGLKFVGCDIKGPAVLLPQQTELINCNLGADPDAVFWPVPPTRPVVSGTVIVLNCTFQECLFLNIGMAGTPEFIEEAKRGAEPNQAMKDLIELQQATRTQEALPSETPPPS